MTSAAAVSIERDAAVAKRRQSFCSSSAAYETASSTFRTASEFDNTTAETEANRNR